MKKIILLITLIFSVINVFGQRHYYVYPSRHHYANVRHRIPVIVEERVMFVHGTDNPRYSIDKWNRCLVIKCNNK